MRWSSNRPTTATNFGRKWSVRRLTIATRSIEESDEALNRAFWMASFSKLSFSSFTRVSPYTFFFSFPSNSILREPSIIQRFEPGIVKKWKYECPLLFSSPFWKVWHIFWKPDHRHRLINYPRPDSLDLQNRVVSLSLFIHCPFPQVYISRSKNFWNSILCFHFDIPRVRYPNFWSKCWKLCAGNEHRCTYPSSFLLLFFWQSFGQPYSLTLELPIFYVKYLQWIS